ncbi:patatin family protein [Paraclostridium bifermentans]|uniref:Patatin family protein n=1 Tax=Paraclostridium bifermentans TaxID=1490 RepID=A0ABY8R572_PARBF|nr:patatin family protein [Paraclostridium bifermentans]
MNKIGLILEGGGMRGIYTAGVLDFFIEKNIEVDITIGVSAGSCHASSYLSKQYKRAYNATVDYINDKRYLSFSNLIKTGSIFGMDFMFNKIPNELNIYDYDTFAKSKSKFVVVATNCETGSPEYFELKDLKKEIIYMQASCSIPMFANIVEIDDFKLVDGGVSDSIPIEYSLNQGYKNNIVVLTRDITYKKTNKSFFLL